MTWVQALVAVVVFGCTATLAVHGFARHRRRAGRPHRLLRSPLGVPVGAPLVIAALVALLASVVAGLSGAAGVVAAGVFVAGTGALMARQRGASGPTGRAGSDP